MYNSPYRSCLHCLKTIYKREGLKAFYRSYTTQMSINIPFQGLHFMTYEACQNSLNPERKYNPKSHVIAGGLAGGLAAAATTPLDVCKTLINTQENRTVSQEGTIKGVRQAFMTVYKYRGVRGYFQGVNARVLYVMPGTAISWSVYEFFKYFLNKRQASCDGYSSARSHVVVASTKDDGYKELFQEKKD